MDQVVKSQTLPTYLHPGPSGPFLELKSEPIKPPSPSTTALLQHNPSLIDLCAFNSLCQRLTETNSTPNTSPYKPLVTPSDLYFHIPENTCTTDINETKPNVVPDTVPSPISSAGECSPNVSSCISTPYSSPKVKHLIQQNSPLDLCVTKELINKQKQMNENLLNSPLTGKEKQKKFRFYLKKSFS